MIKKIILLTCAFTSTLLFSQSQPRAFEDWKTTTGSQNFFYKNITKTDGLGNVYVAGATVNGAGNTDILLAKYNSTGVQLWIRQYAGSANGNDFATDLTVTNSNAFLTGAVTNNTTTMLPDIITMSYKHEGTLLWATTYDGVANSLDIGKAILRDATNGNIYVTGTSYNTSYNADVAIIKYNSSGVQQWANTYDHTTNLDDAGIKVVLKGSTGISVSAALTIGTNQYKYGVFVCSQATGSITSSSISSFITTSSITAVSDFITDASGNTILVGSVYVAGQGDNIYVQKLSSSLVSAWTYTYNNPSNLDDVAKAVQIDASGNVYITGYSAHATEGRNITTIKLNSGGAQQWLQTINSSSNGNDEVADMVIDASSNIYIAGYKTVSANNSDFYTAKYNSSGIKIWEVQTEGGVLNDQVTNIALDSLNNIIVTGQSEVSTGNFEFLTVKYVQKDVIIPADYSPSEYADDKYLYFSNKGQLVNTNNQPINDVLFYTHHTGADIFVKKNSFSLVVNKLDTVLATRDTIQRIDFNFTGSNAETKPYQLEVDNVGLNYFLPQCGIKGITNVRGSQRLVVKDLYPNIDLHYYSNYYGLKMYFVVKPGAKLASLKLNLQGATSTSLTSNASLQLKTFMQDVTFNLKGYQVTSTGSVVALANPATFSLVSAGNYSFSAVPTNTTLPLVLMLDQGTSPAKVTHLGGPEWSTPFGGTGYDEAFDIKTDDDGNSYWIGTTNGAIPFYTPGTGLFNVSFGDFDVFISKFGTASLAAALPNGDIPNGDKLLWSTYYGGSDEDKGYAVALSGNTTGGYVYITGYTKSNNINTYNQSGYYNDTYSGGKDVIVARFKYTSTGMELPSTAWATYLGGTGEDIGNDIKVNGNQIFVGGITTSAPSANSCAVPNTDNDFPTCSPAFKPSNSGATDGFIVNLNTTTGLTSATYIGGSGEDVVNEISVSANNDVYFVGTTNSADASFNTVALTGAYNQNFNGGANDAFVGRIHTAGNWLSFYGGSADEKGSSITSTTPNNFIIGGLTKSSTPVCPACTCAVPSTVGNFPICPKSGSTTFNTYRGGLSDGFMAEFNTNGVYTWGTYIGGDKDNYISSLSFGGEKNYLFFTGETNTQNSATIKSDIGDNSQYFYSDIPDPVPYANSSDGYMGVFNSANLSMHTDYMAGKYSGSLSYTVNDIKTNYNAVHTYGSFYYYAGKTTNFNYYNQIGSGTDFSGAHGAYINSQSWNFNGNQTISPTGGLVNYNPDAAMTRINLHNMPMILNGIKDMSNPDKNVNMLVFPNPTNNILNIFSELQNEDNVVIDVINLLGQSVYSEVISKSKEINKSINVSFLADGVYNICLRGKSFQISKLFVKQ